MSFAKNMSKNIRENISKDLSGKYSQKLLADAKKSEIDALKTASKRSVPKTAKTAGDLKYKILKNFTTKSFKDS